MANESLTTGAASETPVTTETTETQATAPVSETTTEAQPAGSTTAPAKPVSASKWDYKTDKRWGKVWKTPDDIIQGYKSLDDVLEQKYKPSFKQMEDLGKKFKDAGISIDQIDQYIQSYKQYVDPNAPTNQVLNYLRDLVTDDDVSAKELDLALRDLQEKKLQRKYAGLQGPQLKEAMERDKKITELENWKANFENEQLSKQEAAAVTKGRESIDAICKSKGFELTDQIWNEFMDYCIKGDDGKGVETKNMIYAFRQKFDEALDKAFESKIKGTVIDSQRKKAITTAPVKPVERQAPPPGKKASFEERLGKLFTK